MALLQCAIACEELRLLTCIYCLKSSFSPVADHQMNEWRFVQITFSAPHDYQIIIEGVAGSGWRGDIGIDDIMLTTGACPRAGKLERNTNKMVHSNRILLSVTMHH